MVFDRHIEDAVGLFAIALSFASDAVGPAQTIADFADFHGVRCYDYRRFTARQSGLSIEAVEAFVYRTARRVVVLNSSGYLESEATRYEFEVIRRAESTGELIVVELGGRILDLGLRSAQHFSGFSSRIALELVRPSLGECS